MRRVNSHNHRWGFLQSAIEHKHYPPGLNAPGTVQEKYMAHHAHVSVLYTHYCLGTCAFEPCEGEEGPCTDQTLLYRHVDCP